jgi:hypothetical protein
MQLRIARHTERLEELVRESLLVLYLGDEASVRSVVDRLAIEPVAPANPYWSEHGTTSEDPDGFRVVLVPEHWEPPTG